MSPRSPEFWESSAPAPSLVLLLNKTWANSILCRGPRQAGRFPLRVAAATAAAKSLQSCPTLCDPIDGSPPGSPVPGILQARTLEWVAISFSNAWKWEVKVKSLSRATLFAAPWTAAYQAPPPMGFSRQEYWSGLPLPSPYKPLAYIKILKNIYTSLTHWFHIEKVSQDNN